MDLRCYGLTSARNDRKISAHFADIDNFYHEWQIADLPWHAVRPVAIDEEHPEQLDFALIDAINEGPLKDLTEAQSHARAASIAFLYMYLVLTRGAVR